VESVDIPAALRAEIPAEGPVGELSIESHVPHSLEPGDEAHDEPREARKNAASLP
jgi:hypothetical protein